MHQPHGGEGRIYRIRVRGRLDSAWSEWFEGMELIADDRSDHPTTTLIVGFIPDQAALHGVIDRIGALGLTILSVERGETE